MKKFTRIEPTTNLTTGLRYKWDVVIKRFKTEDGLEHEFTTICAEGERAGAVIALTPDNQVITVYQFRAGPERWLYDLPGGGFHSDETSEAAALRELKEETGYEPGSIEYLGESHFDAYSNLIRHYYLATNCVLTDKTDMDAEEHEQGAEVRLISISQLLDDAKQNRMCDPHAVLMAYDTLKNLV